MILITVISVILIHGFITGAGGTQHVNISSISRGSGDTLLVMIIPGRQFQVNTVAAAMIAGGFILFFFMTVKKIRQRSVLNMFPTGDGIKKVRGYARFISGNPDFYESEFLEKARKAFTDIRKAVEKQDLSGVMKFISDGVYQRFNTRFSMMNLLGQTYTIDDPDIKNIYIDRVDADGPYDIIHTAIHASAAGRVISDHDPALNYGGREESVRYWSFIKKRGCPIRDIYFTNDCPGCGSSLPEDPGETGRCRSCDTSVNSGDYDWVLSDIRQADDYLAVNMKHGKSAVLSEKIRRLINENEKFSLRHLEDKAGSGYLQIKTSMALDNPSIMRRFVSDAAYEKITYQMTGHRTAYSRINLNNVALIGVSENRNLNILAFTVKYSFQRMNIDSGLLQVVDPVVISGNEVLLMSRDKNAVKSRGSLYAHYCPGCGARVENSPEVKCLHCRIPMNSTDHEWIITDLLTVREYHDYYDQNAADFNYSVNPDSIDHLYDARDFAFNNVMAIIASGSGPDEQKRNYGRELAVKWKFNVKKIEPFISMAINGMLVLRMPGEPAKQQKVCRLMEEAAAAGQNVSGREKQLLDIMMQQYNIM